MSNPVITALAPGEIGDAVALLQAQLAEHGMTTSERALRDLAQRVLADASLGFILLARIGGEEPLGLVYAAAHLSAEHGGIVGWIEEIYVRPDARGTGFGGRLLQAAIERSQALRWRALELEVVEGHERAAALYQRHGFQRNARARYTRSLPV